MRESRTPGSARGVLSNGHSYRNVRRETGVDQGVQVPNIARVSDSQCPRVMRGTPRGLTRSVDRGADRPAIEPRNEYRSEC